MRGGGEGGGGGGGGGGQKRLRHSAPLSSGLADIFPRKKIYILPRKKLPKKSWGNGRKDAEKMEQKKTLWFPESNGERERKRENGSISRDEEEEERVVEKGESSLSLRGLANLTAQWTYHGFM